MKKTTAILLLLLPLVTLGQDNLVPNPGFENGDTPQPSNCNYFTINPFPDRIDAFDDDVDNWFVATHNIDKKTAVGTQIPKSCKKDFSIGE